MKSILKKCLCILSLPLVMSSCLSSKNQSYGFFAMDTYITVEAETSDKSVFTKIRKLVSSDEKKLSRTKTDSEIYALNEKGALTLSDETANIIKNAIDYSKHTSGAFNPLMGKLTDLWDIKSDNPKVPTEDEIKSALSGCDASNITFDGNDVKINGNGKIDLGGIAKGYSAQRVTDLLRSEGISNALVSFGGSIACIGQAKNNSPWKIGIKNPFDTSDVIGTLSITDCYIAVSGAYERFFEKDGKIYHHILDPKTGYPAESDLESTVVISRDGICADALSTALFVMGFDNSVELYESGIYNFEALLIKKDGTLFLTSDIRDIFSFNENAIYNKEEKIKYLE